MDGENLKELTVADILRLIRINEVAGIDNGDRWGQIALQHGVEDSHTGILSEITEWGQPETFVKAYGWRKLAKMEVESMFPELCGNIATLRIVYKAIMV